MPQATVDPALYEHAFDRMPLPALLLDAADRVVRVTPEAADVLGLPGDTLTGERLHDLVESEDPTWTSADPVDHLGTPTIGREIKARVGGKRRRFRVAVYPLAAEEDAPRLVTVRDADEDEDLDPREVRDHQASLEELCACVAHEIRNPLTGIRTTVQFVGSKLDPASPFAGDLKEVLKEMDRIEEIIGDLLRYGRPAEFSPVEADLNDMVGRLLDSVEAQCREGEVELKRNLSEELKPFPFSPDGLHQVLHNLVRNALEAMPEGGRLKITTSLRKFRSERPAEAEIFVSDTGHGIPEDLLHDIFQPFFTTRHNGTGLGLPISLGIVRAHGGRMTARSRKDGGTTFRISLPLKPEGNGAA